MAERSAWSDYAAETAQLILGAGRDLQEALDEPTQRDFAADQLAMVAESRIGGLDDLGVQGFDPLTATTTQAERTEAVESGLDAVLSQLGMANVLLASAQAVGEEGRPAEPKALGPALRTLANTADELSDRGRDSTDLRQDFGPLAAFPDGRTALEGQVQGILDLLSRRSAQVATISLESITSLVADPLHKVWESIGKQVDLGRVAARFLRLGLRAFEAALGLLGRLVPMERISTVRAKVHALSDRIVAGETAHVAMGWVIGVEPVQREADEVLAADGLDAGRLAQAASTLDGMSVRFTKLMNVADGIAAVLGVLAVVAAALPIMVATQFPVAVAGAYLLLVATVVLIAMDYADSRTGIGLVEGVRAVIRRLEVAR
ncbi:hypothetical protein ACFV9D_16145 [Streptomyces sp. NPDC059875]|uniref:hypothetical protein n=1 Tax=unclassified Streptomyces TaxID=2593676 RepID=UPI003662F447